MSTAILKSPVFIDQRAGVAPPRSAGSMQTVAPPVPDANVALEARLRAELTASLQAQFDARWEAEREQAHAQGYQAGLVEGHAEGKQGAQDAFRKKQALIESVLEQVESEVQGWRQAVQEQAHAIARVALCELLGENALSSALLEGVIRRVTQGLRDQDILAIRLHPREGRLLRDACAAQGEAGGGGGLGQRLVDDGQVQAGGVIVDTPRGEYQATLDTLLRKLLTLVDQQRALQVSQESVPHVRLA